MAKKSVESPKTAMTPISEVDRFDPTKVVMMPIDDIIPYANNAKTHPPEQIAKLAAQIAAHDFDVPIVVDAENVIIKGHGRRLALLKLGRSHAPVYKRTDLSPAKVRLARLADNALADTPIDKEIMSLELKDMNIQGIDLTLTAYEPEQLKEYLTFQAEVTKLKTPEDQIPELPKVATTKPGDIWILGNHRVMCGDSRVQNDTDWLFDGERAEMMFTDPPYGVGYEGGHFHSGDVNIKRKREDIAGDDNADIYAEFLPVALGYVDGPCYLWYAGSNTYPVFKAIHDNGCKVHAVLIWHKTNAKYAAMNAQYKQRHEPCVYFKKPGSITRWTGAATESTLWEEARDAANDLHPTQKPVALAERALRNHSALSVADFFGGSGSTLIAAEKVGMKAFVMELDPKYVDVIVKRWEMATGKKAALKTK